MTLAVPLTVSDPSVRSAVPRLAHEFPELGPRRSCSSSAPAVRSCAARPPTRCPELVERLARQRLRVSLD